MTDNNGAFQDYPGYTPEAIFFRAEAKATTIVTVKSGQVLKKRSFVESIQAGGADKGKVVAHAGMAESAIAKFVALTSGQTLILAGLTFTAGGSDTTVSQLQAAWSNIADGVGFAALSGITAGGTFTAGTLTGWSTYLDPDNSTSTIFTASTALTDVADLVATGTGTSPVISKVDGATVFNTPLVLLYDVDASGGDVDVAVYTKASFWAEAINWKVDPTTDTITIEDGTAVACTAYNTGAFGSDKATTERLRQQFVEGSGFATLGFSQTGELANG